MSEEKLEKALKWIVAILDKHAVPFQITGGFAARLYGSKRPINDIDIDIPEAMMEKLLPDKEMRQMFGLELPVIPPQTLVDYKTLLAGDHKK